MGFVATLGPGKGLLDQSWASSEGGLSARPLDSFKHDGEMREQTGYHTDPMTTCSVVVEICWAQEISNEDAVQVGRKSQRGKWLVDRIPQQAA